MPFQGASGGRKKKGIIVGFAAVVVVAMVVAVAIGVARRDGSSGKSSTNNNGGVTSTSKAMETLCQSTDYKETCVKSMDSAKNSSDVRELVKAAFTTAIKEIGNAVQSSSTLEKAAKDPRTSQAFDVCKQVLSISIDDLNRSFYKFDAFDISKIDEYVEEMKVWIGAVVTNQQTCLDAFENTTGDSGEKMKQLLKTSIELSSNGLAIVSQISKMFSQLEIPGLQRRLLSSEEQSWGQRRLLQANLLDMKPDAVVDPAGGGTHRTINDAVNAIPPKNNHTFIIKVKSGIYKEYVTIPRNANNVVLIGEGPDKTTITGNKNFIDGVTTYRTATFVVQGENFFARDIAFENSAGAEKHQAVALRVSGDAAVFYNCRMDAFQDTLYAHTYRQFYRECNISGTIDFIFGDGLTVFQKCNLIVRKPMANQGCMVTAQGRKDRRSVSAIVLQNCRIVASPEFATAIPPPKAYLGRPWKEFSRTIIMQCDIDPIIAPEGWAPWNGNFGLDTCFYAEFNNKGPGANTAQRVKWPGIKQINQMDADGFTPGKYIQGDLYIKPLAIPYDSGMITA